jgi:3-isopropylmalate dehydrogenase
VSATLGVIRGDGIGPEIIDSAILVCDAAVRAAGSRPIDWVEIAAGAESIADEGLALPARSVAVLERCGGALLGPVDHATYPRYADGRRQNPSGELRKHFDLYANVRPAKTIAGVPSVAAGTDLVIVRENTEGFYSDRNMYRGAGEFSVTADVALSVGVFTRAGVHRVVRFAFELAAQRRGQVTVVHKANVLPETTGMFLDAAEDLKRAHPAITVEDQHVDAMAALLVRRPQTFDVIVAENLFGDILSDLAAELAGSLGLAGSLNVGDDYAIAQAAHGSAPDIAGLGVANPLSEIISAAMLLDWLGRRTDETLCAAARLIDSAITEVLPTTATRDLGGRAGTRELTEAIVTAIGRAPVSAAT